MLFSTSLKVIFHYLYDWREISNIVTGTGGKIQNSSGNFFVLNSKLAGNSNQSVISKLAGKFNSKCYLKLAGKFKSKCYFKIPNMISFLPKVKRNVAMKVFS